LLLGSEKSDQVERFVFSVGEIPATPFPLDPQGGRRVRIGWNNLPRRGGAELSKAAPNC
jgi:hypothetical protein